MRIRVEVLGTGTSTGVPVPACSCSVCHSTNPKNQRLRTSAFVRASSVPGISENTEVGILIDSSTDLRAQALRAKINRVDAVLYTHSHADHIFGLDDLRSFNFVTGTHIPLYANPTTSADLRSKFTYAFVSDPDYEGGAPPMLSLHQITPFRPFNIHGVQVLPIPVWHGKLEVSAYRIGNFAYVTDCSAISEDAMEQLCGLEVLILDALRIRPHKTHFTQEEAVRVIEQLRPKQSYLTHISHEVDHEESNERLKRMSGLPIQLAYDGLVIELPS